MGFVKEIKSSAYYKRYQVKFRRRREAKTDYAQRQRLITQDKNKYNTAKYRFVVRITNRDVICQVFSADLTHDKCLASAYSHELKRYGVVLGLTNYAAAYCTGLLLARRINKKFNLDYEGTDEVSGDVYQVEANEDGPAPFRAFLDVGLARTSTGARVFGALKGACDGGLDIPHNGRRFPGSYVEDGNHEQNPDKHRDYIFGQHVANYMRELKEEDEEAFNKQFARYVKNGVSADDLEDMYANAHKAIRADPFKARSKKEKAYFCSERANDKATKFENKHYNKVRLSIGQRKNNIKQRLLGMGKTNVAVKL